MEKFIIFLTLIFNLIVSASSFSQTESQGPILGLLPPPAPILIVPDDNSFDVSLTPTLTWSTSPISLEYRIEISTSPGFNVLTDWAIVSVNNYTVPAGKLSIAVTYFWRVNASNTAGTSSWSQVWCFSTQTGPSAPMLISPPNFIIGVPLNPVLIWQGIEGAISYKVQVSTISNFTVITDSAAVSNTQYTIPMGKLSNNYTYFWRVCSVGQSGTGPWSVVWRFTVLITGVNKISVDVPKEFRLYQNYPNPFNPSTKIRFDLPKGTNLKIYIYDISGRELDVLANGFVSAGKFEVSWQAQKYSSGIYFLKLISSDFQDTKRMVLIK